MKKLGKKRKQWLIRQSRTKIRRKKKRTKKIALRRRLIQNFSTITAPDLVGLADVHQRSETLQFLKKIRETGALHGKSIRINFSDTSKMIADGTLLLTAELMRLKRITGGQIKFRCIEPRSQKVAQVLKQIGLFSFMQHRSSVKPTLPDVVSWRFASGNNVDGKQYDAILGAYDGVFSKGLSEGLYVGLAEAMTNCHHHAYISVRKDGLNIENEVRDWWMFSQEKDGNLFVAFCDLGVGIPETLPITRPSRWAKMMKNVGRIDVTDGRAILEAIEDSRSRTGARNRGHGLKQLIDVIQATPGSRLAILSNSGMYVSMDGEEKIFDFADSVLGTLIFWRVPLNRPQ